MPDQQTEDSELKKVKRYSMYVQRYNLILAWTGFAWPKCAMCGKRHNLFALVDILKGDSHYKKTHFCNQRLCRVCAQNHKIKHINDKGWVSLRDDIDW